VERSVTKKSRGLLYPAHVKGKFGFINRKGEMVIPPRFDSVYCVFGDSLAPVRFGGKEGYIDRRGRWVIRPRFELAFPFSEGLAAVLVGVKGRRKKYGYIDRQGRMVNGAEWGYAGEFSEGFAPVMRGKKWGFIDNKGMGTECLQTLH